MGKEDRKFAPPPELRRPDLSDISFTPIVPRQPDLIGPRLVQLETALREIANIPAVPYSLDQLLHAQRTIEEMVRIAKEALG